MAYRVEQPKNRTMLSTNDAQWLKAWPEGGSTHFVQLGSRVVLQLKPGTSLDGVIRGHSLQKSVTFAPDLYVLQAPDALTAAREAQVLASHPDVLASHPVSKRHLGKHSPYAPLPNDPYFPMQWHLENRDSNGVPIGVDINARSAWALTRGEGVIVAQADDGVELGHPELTPRSAPAYHFNFPLGTQDGSHPSTILMHGTCVAGLILAEQGNNRGVSGVAPHSQLASWVIFDSNDNIATDEQLAQMFQYLTNVVSVQNHSWGSGEVILQPPGVLEQVAISNAVIAGRNGKGMVMVRSAGNLRLESGNANDDGYANDPRVIAVAAVRSDGRAARYSNPGACLLVAAPSAEINVDGTGLDANYPTLFTTDRLGSLGYNFATYPGTDLADYAFGGSGFSGTSGAAPQITGIVALMLSVNPNLTYRDVQQILIFSSHHVDLADPDLARNGAGFLFSHNVGFGIPDAGVAVRLAKTWVNRPPMTNLVFSASNVTAVPDAGLRVELTAGTSVIASFEAAPDLGPNVDTATATLPVFNAGYATNAIGQSLTGQCALILRGPTGTLSDTRNFFSAKIGQAAAAGAAFAIVYDNTNNEAPPSMGLTDYVPIPAVMISQADGLAILASMATNTGVSARITLTSANYSFNVTNTLLCEHVGVQIGTTYTNRKDLRITLLSPTGTRSVLQRINADKSAQTNFTWTYYSKRHYFESSAGTWTVSVGDEASGNIGSVTNVVLTIAGVPIVDTDHDGLDDNWEMAYFGSLKYGPNDDPDGDGYSNMREQIMGTNPTIVDSPFRLNLDLSVWSSQSSRLSWPSVTNTTYQIQTGATPLGPFTVITNVPGSFPETEFFVPYTSPASGFFRLMVAPTGP